MRIKIKHQEETGRSGRPSRWVAMGPLAACAATGGGPATLLRAQQPGQRGPSRAAEQTLPVFRLAIEAGPLGEALAAFEKATGWKVEIPDPGMATLPRRAFRELLPAPTGPASDPGRNGIDLPHDRSLGMPLFRSKKCAPP